MATIPDHVERWISKRAKSARDFTVYAGTDVVGAFGAKRALENIRELVTNQQALHPRAEWEIVCESADEKQDRRAFKLEVAGQPTSGDDISKFIVGQLVSMSAHVADAWERLATVQQRSLDHAYGNQTEALKAMAEGARLAGEHQLAVTREETERLAMLAADERRTRTTDKLLTTGQAIAAKWLGNGDAPDAATAALLASLKPEQREQLQGMLSPEQTLLLHQVLKSMRSAQ